MKKTRTRSQISRTNRTAGQKAERDGRKWLLMLDASFNVSLRRSQYRGGKTDGNELVINDKVCVEVKRTQAIGVGTKALHNAMEQAKRDANGRPFFVLWRNTGQRQHCVTFIHPIYGQLTADTNDAARQVILFLLQE